MIEQLKITGRILATTAVCIVTGFALTLQLIKLDEALTIARAIK